MRFIDISSVLRLSKFPFCHDNKDTEARNSICADLDNEHERCVLWSRSAQTRGVSSETSGLKAV